KRAGGSLDNVVTMTVFIKESRYGDRFVEMRKDLFRDGNYPGSALITVTNFSRPGIEIEVQAVGVIGDACSADNPCSAQAKAKQRSRQIVGRYTTKPSGDVAAPGTMPDTASSLRVVPKVRVACRSKLPRCFPAPPTAARRSHSRCTPSQARACGRPHLSVRVSIGSRRSVYMKTCVAPAPTREHSPVRLLRPPHFGPSALRIAPVAAPRGPGIHAPHQSRSADADRAPASRNPPMLQSSRRSSLLPASRHRRVRCSGTFVHSQQMSHAPSPVLRAP